MGPRAYLGVLQYDTAGILANDCMLLGAAYMKAVMDLDNPQVQSAGFFVMNRTILDHWRGDSLKREVFPNLLAGRHLAAFRHDGLFKSTDNDLQESEALFVAGMHRWAVSDSAAP